MTRRARRWGVIAVVAAMTLAACQDDSSDGPRAPTEAQAREVLQQYVDQAKVATDAKSYCSITLFTDMCESSFDRWGGAVAIPKEAPTVVDVRDGGEATTVLVVCGTTGEGRPYRTDFAVHHEADKDRTDAVVPVFWSGTTWSGQVDGNDPVRVTATAGSADGNTGPPC